MSRKSIQYICADDGLELVLFHDEPRTYPWHFHARHWTLGLVRAGSVTVTTLTGSFSLSPGETFSIPPLAPHRLDIEGQSSLAVLCVIDPLAHGGMFFTTAQGCESPDLISWLENPFAEPTLAVEELPVEEASPLGAVRRLLISQPDDHFPLKILARFAGFSPSYFLRAFKKETGLTPHAFQLICRVSRARELLRTGAAAAEAAASSGFTDQSHLHKVFKRHHGLTPGQFDTASFRPKR